MKQNLIRSIQLVKLIHQRVNKNIFLQANAPLLLTLSGGQDSMAIVSFFLQKKNQRRFRMGFCWCNHLWRYDSFHAMHHLMRLAFIVKEPISFLMEPTSDAARGGEKDLKKIDGPPLRTFYTNLLRPRKKKGVFFYPQGGRLLSPPPRRQGGRWSNEKLRRSEDHLSPPSASSMLMPKTPSLTTIEVISLAQTEGRANRKEKKKLSSTEEGARSWRYQSFQRLAIFHGFRILQVGHTASDRIETGVFHLFRGGGMRGVAGIQRSRVFRKLYPKHFSFSNFYAIDFKKFEDGKNGSESQQKRLDRSVQKTFQGSPYQKSHQESIFYQNGKVTNFLNQRNVRLTRLTSLVGAGRYTKDLGKDLLYGAKETQFFYSSFLERKNEILLLHRPLLSVSRSDVRRVCRLWQLPIYPDASNQNLHYARNRIRNQLLPTLRLQFNPQLDGMLLHFTILLSTEQLYLDYLSERLFPSVCIVAREYMAFDVGGLKAFPLAIRRQIMKHTLEKYATSSLHLSHIDTLFQFLEKKKPERHRFPRKPCLCLFSKRIGHGRGFRKRKAREVEQRKKQTSLKENEMVSSFFPPQPSLREEELVQKEGVISFLRHKHCNKDSSPFFNIKETKANVDASENSFLPNRFWKKGKKGSSLFDEVEGRDLRKARSILNPSTTGSSLCHEVEGRTCLSRLGERFCFFPVIDVEGIKDGKALGFGERRQDSPLHLVRGKGLRKAKRLNDEGKLIFFPQNQRHELSLPDDRRTEELISFQHRRRDGSSRSKTDRRCSDDRLVSSPSPLTMGGMDLSLPSSPRATEGGWTNRIGMPTQQFLPTVGSFLFLGNASFLEM